MRWQVFWETDATKEDELNNFDFELLGEHFAQDGNVPIAEEL